MKRQAKRKNKVVPFSSRISEKNKKWIKKHADAVDVSQAAWFDMLLTSIREAEEGMNKKGGILDFYGKKLDAILDEVVQENRR